MKTCKGLGYLPFIYLWTGVRGQALTALAPPVHLSGDRLGWTLLVCLVTDLRRGHLEVAWQLPPGRHPSESPVSLVVVTRRHLRHSPVSAITVVTNDWPAYRCSARHKRRHKAGRRHTIGSSDEEQAQRFEEILAGRTNSVLVSSLRLLLLKILVINTLLTVHSVVKWQS